MYPLCCCSPVRDVVLYFRERKKMADLFDSCGWCKYYNVQNSFCLRKDSLISAKNPKCTKFVNWYEEDVNDEHDESGSEESVCAL